MLLCLEKDVGYNVFNYSTVCIGQCVQLCKGYQKIRTCQAVFFTLKKKKKKRKEKVE